MSKGLGRIFFCTMDIFMHIPFHNLEGFRYMQTITFRWFSYDEKNGGKANYNNDLTSYIIEHPQTL